MSTPSGTIKYLAVRVHLLSRIEQFEPGTRLPPEPVLCGEYGVSRITLRHAVDGLIDDGRLVRKQGLGTFVVEPQYPMRYRERFADEVTGFFTQQTNEGAVVTTRVLDQSVVLAGERVAGQLRISPADKVVSLTRLRYVNGTLHHLVHTFMPFAMFPDTAEANFTGQSLYHYLAERHGVTLQRNDLLVSIEPAPLDAVEHLGVAFGEKLLKVASTVFDATGRAVAYGTSHFAPNNSEITFGLHSS